MVNHMELILDQIDKATSSNTVLVKSVRHDDKDENELKSECRFRWEFPNVDE